MGVYKYTLTTAGKAHAVSYPEGCVPDPELEWQQ